MTRGNKVLWLLLFEVALVGGAAGAAVYVYRAREVLPAQAALTQCQKAGSALMTRAMLTDALIALYQNNPALAFERVTRAQLSAQAAGLKLERDLDEVMMMLADPVRIQQTPQRLQEIANKLLQGPPDAKGAKGAPPAPAKGAPPAPAKDAPAPAGKEEGKGAPPAAKDAPPAAKDAPPTAKDGKDAPAAKDTPPAAPKQEAGQAPAAPPVGAAAAAILAPSAPSAPSAPPGRPRAEQALDEGYRAILDAKTALIAGSGGEGVIGKLARARVMLDEAGRGEAVGEELDAALSALRRNDETRARNEIEAALKKLR